ncbi:MAG TPA: FAD-linked oxidase C-terminal domain-containing protein, partial [Armatimonadota bacterium]|nr:FAD-linked oxidase C-terminal domain-containing protein [Armatimonadota bacterium]
PERLAAYIRDLRALLQEYGLDACYYAHASVGCLHVRPVLSLKEPGAPARMREIAGRVADLVLRYDGAMSAEHGDGLARSEWQERMFGSRLYQAFRELKAAFDPQGIMNPGKIVDAPPMDQNLRVIATGGAPVLTVLDFSRDGGLERAAELCSGAGACRKKLDGAMCPSYRATLDETHSTRGRANMLRMVLAGASGSKGLADPRLREVLDLCLECKTCKSECPSNVDMAKLKYEFLAHYHAAHGAPVRARLLGHIAELSRLASPVAPVANWLQSLPAVRLLLDRLGIDRRRKLPAFAERPFADWWRVHRSDARAGVRGDVMLLIDTFTRYNEPEVGQSAVRVLEAVGYRVRVPELKCCGRPLISKGFLAEARANALHNLAELAPHVHRGLPLLTLEPSCGVTFKDEYTEFGLGDLAQTVAGTTWLLEDFLAARHEGQSDLPFRPQSREVRFHGHCHQKAVFGTAGALSALRMVPGYEVSEIPSGCCGMAGTFGYEKEHYDLSLQIGELSLFPHVRSAPEDALIVAPGTSCRHQIAHATG